MLASRSSAVRRVMRGSTGILRGMAQAVTPSATDDSQQEFFRFENSIVTADHSASEYTSKSTEVETGYATKSQIIGNYSQVVRFELAPKQSVRCEPHSMLWMDRAMELQTSVGEDWLSGFSRAVSGGPLFVTDFRNTSPTQTSVLVLGAQYPARVLPFDLREFGGSISASSAAFLAGPSNVTVSAMTAPSITAALFGGAGVFLQRIQADDVVFLHAGGAVARRELRANETLKVNPGCILAMETSVDFDVEMVSGLSNIFFGQGLFLSTLRGPGHVWLQALPWSRVESRILSKASTMSHSHGSSSSSSSSHYSSSSSNGGYQG